MKKIKVKNNNHPNLKCHEPSSRNKTIKTVSDSKIG